MISLLHVHPLWLVASLWFQPMTFSLLEMLQIDRRFAGFLSVRKMFNRLGTPFCGGIYLRLFFTCKNFTTGSSEAWVDGLEFIGHSQAIGHFHKKK